MLRRVKNWLGIEGVKLELELPEKVTAAEGQVVGKIRFYSMQPQTVTLIKVFLTERYTRGRRKEKRIDEYCLGQIDLLRPIDIPANDPVEVEFTLPFEMLRSEVDEFEERNILTKGLAYAAKYLYNAKSNYFVEAEAKVKGTGLNPFDKQEVEIV